MTTQLPQAIPLLTFTLTAPIVPPLGDPQITQVEIREIHMRLVGDGGAFPNGIVRVFYGAVGDPRTREVDIALSAANQTNFQNAIKNAITAQTGVTFQ